MAMCVNLLPSGIGFKAVEGLDTTNNVMNNAIPLRGITIEWNNENGVDVIAIVESDSQHEAQSVTMDWFDFIHVSTHQSD